MAQVHAAANLAKQFNEAARRLHEQSALAIASAKGQITDTSAIHSLLGTTFGSVMLQAFALELIIKALRYKHSLPRKTRADGHNLLGLFADLPKPIKDKVAAAYADKVSTSTLDSLLRDYARAFEEWRYMFEYNPKEAALGDLQNAFDAICEEVDAPQRSR